MDIRNVKVGLTSRSLQRRPAAFLAGPGLLDVGQALANPPKGKM